MGDDIQMGAQNEAGAQTNLLGRVNSDGTWPGDTVFNVAAQVLAPLTINGIRAVGQKNATPQGIPVGGVGVIGIGDTGVVGEGETVGVIGRGVGTSAVMAAGVFGQGAPGKPGVVGQAGDGTADGVQGFGTGTFSGVAGFGDPSANGTGVFGQGRGPQAPGVRGIGSGGPNTVPGGAVGVYGQAGAVNNNGVEGHGSGTFAGVSGLGDSSPTANSGIGVFAVGGAPPPNSTQPGGPGVHAIGAGGPPFAPLNRAVGVFAAGGSGSFPGVLGVGGQPASGSNIGGPGIQGFGFGSPLDPVLGGAFGVYGRSGIDGSPAIRGDGGADNAAGVLGVSNLGAGVSGFSNLGDGISGQSTGGVGVRGFSEKSVGVSAEGDTLVPGTIGLVASGNHLAAQFNGNVLVQGNFTVTGTKAAAVPFPDGSNRQLYCMESPESWFEDFGFGELVEGQAQVELDPGFRSVVSDARYHVFITEYDDHNALFVSSRTSEGFLVRAKGSKANSAFSYRVVARRKGSMAPRFEKVLLSNESIAST